MVETLKSLAMANGIREAIVTSCIGSFRNLKLRNLCAWEEGSPEFQRHDITETMELVSAEGYIQPLPDGELRVHIHVAAARSALKDYLRRLNEPKQPDDSRFESLIEAPFKVPPKKKSNDRF